MGGGDAVAAVIAVIICEQCGEATDCSVLRHNGATDLIPDQCPECETDWPLDALNDPATEVYA